MTAHSFLTHSYKTPTYCDVCTRLLWGIVRQGMQCTQCKCNVHKGCMEQVLVTCPNTLNQPFKEFKEPLNLITTTPANYSRYVARLGPIVAINDEIMSVMTWDNPGKTVAYAFVYSFLCFYPKYIVMLPLVIFMFQLLKNANSPKKPVQLLKNMKFIQGHMGSWANMKDAMDKAVGDLIYWEDREKSMKVCIASMALFIAAILVLQIPRIVNIGFFLWGNLTLLMNTTFFRDFSDSSVVVLKDIVEKKHQIVLFENQRWWAGLGWIPVLLPGERACWSDMSGTLQLSNISDYELEPGFEWSDKEWKIHESALNYTDEQGWQYSDNAWQPKSRCTIGSYTRRRCWRRRFIKITKEE